MDARTPGVDEGFSIQNVPAGREVENPLLVRNVATGMKFILMMYVRNQKLCLSKSLMSR